MEDKMLCFLAFMMSVISGFRGFPIKTVERSRIATSLDAVSITGCHIQVKDIAESSKVYDKLLPKAGDDFQLSNECTLQLRPWINSGGADNVYNKGGGYIGLTIARPDAELIAEEFAQTYPIVRKYDSYSFGASIFPDEDEMKVFPVSYGQYSDPNNFRVEIREDINTYSHIVLNVINLEKSLEFYEGVLGFNLLRRRSNVWNKPREAAFSIFLGDKEKEGVLLELYYKYSTDSIDQGNAFQEIAVKVSDLKTVFDKAEAQNLKVIQGSDGSIVLTDPNGYKLRVSAA